MCSDLVLTVNESHYMLHIYNYLRDLHESTNELLISKYKMYKPNFLNPAISGYLLLKLRNIFVRHFSYNGEYGGALNKQFPVKWL